MKHLRWISLLCALCLLLTGFSVGTVATAEAEDPIELVLTAGDAAGQAGDLVQIPITYSHAAGYGIKEGAIFVQYDPTALQPEVPLNEEGKADWDMATGTPLQYAAVQVAATRPGELMISFVSPSCVFANEGLLIELPFRVITGHAIRASVTVTTAEEFTFWRLDNHEAVGLEQADTYGATVRIAETALGDVDGDEGITTTDARLVLQYAVGKITDSDLTLAVADVDGDKAYTTTDARLILQYAVDKIDRFPAESGSTTPGATTTTPGSDDTTTTAIPKPTEDPNKTTGTSTGPTSSQKPIETTKPDHTDPTTTQSTKATINTTRTSQPIVDNSPDPDFNGHRRGSLVDDDSSISNNVDAMDRGLFGKFVLCQEDNEFLPYSVACYISPTYSAVTALLPSGVDLREIVVRFTVNPGVTVSHSGQQIISGVTVLNLRNKFYVQLTDAEGNVKDVLIKVMTLDTGLPTMSMITEDRMPVDSKLEYKNASFTLFGGDDSTCDYAITDPVMVDGKVKGRGNTSWNQEKKSFTIKFNEKRKLLDMDNSKDWVLVAGHEDFTLLRNVIGQYLGECADVSYTLDARPVDLWYNGEFWGTYILTEKIEIEGSRVDIAEYAPGCAPGDTGFLLEFDSHVAESNFMNNKDQYRVHLGEGYEVYYNDTTDELFFQPNFPGGKWCTIKKPDYTKYLLMDNDQIRYIYDYVNEAAKALTEGSYEDVCKYIDVESFANWYIVEELMNNTDSSMHSSVYMSKDVNGKLKMGPVWDFDRSSGGNTWTAAQSVATAHLDINSLLYHHREAWFYYSLYKHPEGRAVLKTQWNKFYAATADLGDVIEDWYDVIKRSAEQNFKKWSNVLGSEAGGSRNNPHIGDSTEEELTTVTYEGQVNNLKNYLLRRRDAMNTYINQTLPNEGY
ncbi:MAG: CotH kinase family protein [Clostridia bacterium]|nr:CotH kinase family protein [Clostridia bacterium]